MRKTTGQPIVAVVGLKRSGIRFEIVCHKNKVLPWRSGLEDLDKVLLSQIVYSNVSKGDYAKFKDLIAVFGTDDHSKICLEILERGELQVDGKERESPFSTQFRDIATIVMQKTINPKTSRPYTVDMIECFMHEIHFAVDPNSSSMKQALEVIRELQKCFAIQFSPMRLRLTVATQHFPSLVEKLVPWNAGIVSKDELGSHPSMICDIEPGFYRECDAFIRDLQGRLEILAGSLHFEGDTQVEEYDEHEDSLSSLPVETTEQLAAKMQKQSVSETESKDVVEKNNCSTCEAFVGEGNEFKEHFKSDWHKHNLKRKMKELPPLTSEECLDHVDLGDSRAGLKEYSF